MTQRPSLKMTPTLAKIILEQLQAHDIPTDQPSLCLVSDAQPEHSPAIQLLMELQMPLSPSRSSVYSYLKETGIITQEPEGNVHLLNLARLNELAISGHRRPSIAELAAGRSGAGAGASAAR